MEQKKRSAVFSAAAVGAKLLLICALVAGIISFVYALTIDAYEKNLQNTKNQAIGSIFSLSSPVCEQISDDGASETVYKVYEGERFVGYCVEVKRGGFGGDVELMVGYTEAGEVGGVSVVAHAETPGFGARITEAAFLDQYKGATGDVTLGEGIDAISGATISSKAVTDAVNLATASLQSTLAKGGAQ